MFPLYVGKNDIQVLEVGSTNELVMQLLKEKKLPEGTLIRATNQIAGKGQRGNKWLTYAGKNFTGTYIFYPVFLAAKDQFWLNKAIAIAVAQTVKHFAASKTVEIKWPNDILVEQKKIAGILLEGQLNGNQLALIVAGIGVNINQEQLPQATFKATSLYLENGETLDLDDFTTKLSELLEIRYSQVKLGNYTKIDSDYDAYLFGKGKLCLFEWKNEILQGIVKGVSKDGQLEVDMDGLVRLFQNGEVKWIVES